MQVLDEALLGLPLCSSSSLLGLYVLLSQDPVLSSLPLSFRFIFFLVFIPVSSLFFFSFSLSLGLFLLRFFFFSFFLWLMGLTRWGEVEVPCSSRAISVFGSASLVLLVSSRLVLPPALYRAGLLVVHLPPSLPFQDEDKRGLGCWCSARTRTPTLPPRLDCWWWILTRTLAVYLEGQHDSLGTLFRPHRSAFATFEPPVMGGILNFFLTGSFLCSQRKKTMNGNETAPFLGWAALFPFDPRSWLVLIKPLVQIVIRPLDFGA